MPDKFPELSEAELLSLQFALRQTLLDRVRHEPDPILTYGELVAKQSIRVPPDDPQLHRLLDKISIAADKAGEGLLSVVVVNGQVKLPGDGFYEMARHRGRDCSSKHKLFERELAKVIEIHKEYE